MGLIVDNDIRPDPIMGTCSECRKECGAVAEEVEFDWQEITPVSICCKEEIL